MAALTILLNGPARVGKDTVAAFLAATPGLDAVELKFSQILKEEVHASFGMEPGLPFDFFEAVKDEPSILFRGLSPRQAYIKVGGEIRAKEGQDWFASLWLERARFLPNAVVVASDVRFAPEAEAARALGRTELWRVRRPGHSWSSDIGSYLPDEAADLAVDLWNDGTEAALGRVVAQRAKAALKG